MKCYYYDGKNSINKCEKFKKCNLSRADIIKKYKERLLKNTKKSYISINEAALSSKTQESTYSIEQTEHLLRGMQPSDSNSGSD